MNQPRAHVPGAHVLCAHVTACATEDGMVLLDERIGRYWQLNITGAAVVAALLDGATDTATYRTMLTVAPR